MSNVDYQTVRLACCALLAQGERPARPNVLSLVATPEYLGHKGSNAIVQGYINDFWIEVGERISAPPRTVADIPDAFVAILDKALVDMVAAAQKIAEDGLASQRRELEAKEQAMEEAVRHARDAALASEQQCLRAEAERDVLHARCNEIRGDLDGVNILVAEERQKNEGLAKVVEEKDAELRRQFEALETSSRSIEQLGDQYRTETCRLMKQVDDERQLSLRERQRSGEEIDQLRKEIAGVRHELGVQREARVRLATENESLAQRLAEMVARCSSVEDRANQHQQAVAALQGRYELAESQRQALELRTREQAEKIGNLQERLKGREASGEASINDCGGSGGSAFT